VRTLDQTPLRLRMAAFALACISRTATCAHGGARRRDPCAAGRRSSATERRSRAPALSRVLPREHERARDGAHDARPRRAPRRGDRRGPRSRRRLAPRGEGGAVHRRRRPRPCLSRAAAGARRLAAAVSLPRPDDRGLHRATRARSIPRRRATRRSRSRGFDSAGLAGEPAQVMLERGEAARARDRWRRSPTARSRLPSTSVRRCRRRNLFAWARPRARAQPAGASARARLAACRTCLSWCAYGRALVRALEAGSSAVRDRPRSAGGSRPQRTGALAVADPRARSGRSSSRSTAPRARPPSASRSSS
jgi:hypothetical protein